MPVHRRRMPDYTRSWLARSEPFVHKMCPSIPKSSRHGARGSRRLYDSPERTGWRSAGRTRRRSTMAGRADSLIVGGASRLQPAIRRWIVTVHLSKRAHEAASTRIASMAHDFVDREGARPELLGCLPHANVAEDEHRRPADDLREARDEGRPAEQRGA